MSVCPQHAPASPARYNAVRMEPPGPLVIVDDMITSGSTARRCLEALRGRPVWFFAWSLNWGRS